MSNTTPDPVGPGKSPRAMSVAQASGVMALAIFFSRVLGLIRDAVISKEFGLDPARDAYVAAFAIPDLMFFLVAGGALSSAFIPVFTKYWTNGEEDRAWRLFGSLATIMCLALLAFIALATLFAVPFMELLRPGLPDDTLELAARLSIILLPSQIGFFLGGLMIGTLNARGHFVAGAVAPNVYNVGIIFGAAVLATAGGLGIFGLAWGALVGALIGNLAIPFMVMRAYGSRFQPSLDFKDEGVRRVFKLMLPVVLGLSLPGVYALIVGGFGSYFGPGALSALDIGNRIMQAPLGIVGQSLAIAIFPTLVALYVKNEATKFLTAVSKTLRVALYLGLFVSAMTFVFAADIVQALNQYGEFGNQDTAFVSAGLRLFSVGIFAWCCHPVLMRSFFAMEDTVTPVVLGTAATGVFIVLAWLLPRTDIPRVLASGVTTGGAQTWTPEWNYAGLALAISVAAIVLFVLLLTALRRKLGRIDGSRIVRCLLIGGGAAAAAAVAAHFGNSAASQSLPDGPVWAIARVSTFGLAAGWLYLGLGNLFRLEEARYALSALRRRTPQSEDA